jgi:SAM-dependent methyltransferase
LDKCPLCISTNIKKIKLNRIFVTSDVKRSNFIPVLCECSNCSHIFKIINIELLSSINLIYANYEIYKLSNGQPELINFTNNISKNQTLINFIELKINKSNPGKKLWLDYGCGNGSLIDEVKILYGESFFIEGYDQYVESTRNDITNKIENLESKVYDVISLVHVLEHVEQPVQLVKSLLKKLKQDGFIVINIPNIIMNPYDLFVVDHLHHFNKYSLNMISRILGNIKIDYYDLIDNQILAIVSNSKLQNNVNLNNVNLKSILQFTDNKIEAINSIRDSYYMFGTSVASQFLINNSTGKVINYIDENLNKIGKELNGIKTINLSDAKKDKTLVLPLGQEFSKNLFERLTKLFKSVL